LMRVELRSYQKKALAKALRMRKCVIVMPTGSGKTIVAGAWLSELFKNSKIKRALVLEPTRILVDQNSLVFKEKFDLDARPLHGRKRREEKEWALEGKVVVATPEEAEVWLEHLKDREALVVDECHHTVGKDPYVKVVSSVEAEWRLGLTAFVPSARKEMIEKYIGPIVEIDWSDEELKKYVPPYIGEVYEAPLEGPCERLYEELKSEWQGADPKKRILLSMAMRFLARDGPLALYESSQRSTSLGNLLKKHKPLIEECVRYKPLHKMPALKRALSDHDFDKALVFVDRVIVAKKIAEEVRAELLIGKQKPVSIERIRKAKIIVATSAGEEGIDLPEADLLVIWSNTSSALRFIQRVGRLLRPRKDKKLKFLVFIVTPDTIDMDLLVEGLEIAKKVGVDPNIDPEILKRLLTKTSVGSVLELLKERALPEDVLAELASVPLTRARRLLKKFGEEGLVGYVHTPYGKLWYSQDSPEVLEEYRDILEPYKNVELKLRELGIRGDLETVLRKARKELPLGPLTVEVRARERDMEIFEIRKYSFKISNERVLEVVLKNAASKGLLS